MSRWITTECQVSSCRSLEDCERMGLPTSHAEAAWVPVVFALADVIGYRDDGIDDEPATNIYFASGAELSIRMSFVQFDELHAAHRRTSGGADHGPQ